MNTLQSLALGVRAIAVACDAPRVRDALAELLRGHGLLSEPLPELAAVDGPPLEHEAPELVTSEPVSAAERMRAYRARQRDESLRDPLRQRYARNVTRNVTVVTDQGLSFLSPDLKSQAVSEVVSGSCELFSTVNTREGGAESVTQTVTPAVTNAKKKGRALRQKTSPPSENDPAAVTAWCEQWKLPLDHPELAHFLDVFRSNGTPHANWAATWRVFLRNQPRFAPMGGARRAAPELQPVGVNGRAWKVGEGDGH